MKTSILVVDDDPEILSLLRRGFNLRGLRCQYRYRWQRGAGEGSGKKSLTWFILDVMMPGLGWHRSEQAPARRRKIPILMLTAKGTVPDRITGLDSGADDYMVKPFSFDELLARVRALIRRSQPHEEETLNLPI